MNQEANEELLVTFQAYQKKELDLLNSLHAINESFQELGIPLSSLKEFDNQPTLSDHDLIRQSGIRMKNKLSFRGRDKSREYFKLIDLNRDGLVGYEEFRGDFRFHCKNNNIIFLLTFLKLLTVSEMIKVLFWMMLIFPGKSHIGIFQVFPMFCCLCCTQ